MFKRIVSILLFLCVLVSLLFFIASAIKIDAWVAELDHRSEAINQKRIVLIAQELNTPYWKLLEQGAREQADTYDYLLQYVGPLRHDPAQQRRLLHKALSAKPDAIITQGLIGQEELFTSAKELGIPVITIDTDAPSSERIAYIGTDNKLAGEQLASLLLSQLPHNNTNIGVIMGSSAENQTERLDSFQRALSEAPSFHVVDVRLSNISRVQAAQATIDMLEKRPDIDVIVGLSGLDAVGIVDGLDALNNQHVSVFGFDNLLHTETLIAEGRMLGSIVQQPVEIGKQAIDTLHSYYEKVPFAEHMHIATTVLTAKEVEADHED